jgi:hypothetical protein
MVIESVKRGALPDPLVRHSSLVERKVKVDGWILRFAVSTTAFEGESPPSLAESRTWLED